MQDIFSLLRAHRTTGLNESLMYGVCNTTLAPQRLVKYSNIDVAKRHALHHIKYTIFRDVVTWKFKSIFPVNIHVSTVDVINGIQIPFFSPSCFHYHSTPSRCICTLLPCHPKIYAVFMHQIWTRVVRLQLFGQICIQFIRAYMPHFTLKTHPYTICMIYFIRHIHRK